MEGGPYHTNTRRDVLVRIRIYLLSATHPYCAAVTVYYNMRTDHGGKGEQCRSRVWCVGTLNLCRQYLFRLFGSTSGTKDVYIIHTLTHI